MLEELTQRIVDFRQERDWKQFHTPRTLAASIAVEAGELLEIFQWSSDATMEGDVQKRRRDVQRELADIAIYTLLMAHDLDIDLEIAIQTKLTENAMKYPLEKAKGRREKYTEL
jgi:NTP pyrophosphatase (non-canonical NTP hydrolase)